MICQSELVYELVTVNFCMAKHRVIKNAMKGSIEVDSKFVSAS